MYYHLIYHVPNTTETYISAAYASESLRQLYHRLCYNLTNGRIRSFCTEINFVITRNNYTGFEVIISYPDHFVPDQFILFTILREEEAMFDIHYFDKPINYDRLHLHQISASEFLKLLSRSPNPLQNASTLIYEYHRQHLEQQELKYRTALNSIKDHDELLKEAKEPHVL